ncbi:MAG: L-seryl-tRNA(Sec) selenium transferase [Deltaproteobacteria bacterium]|nr:L-seryl-tRNA(Sec) selenium transferase [Deltaproteobacteria bacterium]
MDLEPTVNSDARRVLPSVDRLTRELGAIAPGLPTWAVLRASRDVLESIRQRMSQGDSKAEGAAELLAMLVEEAMAQARRLSQAHPRRVINATGVLLHTNLGRAPLAEAAQLAVTEAARGYSSLELDLATGRRGSRLGRLESKLLALSGAEAAHVVNNNAAAVLLALNTLALGRRVIVSRGELVEIGGAFRVPAIMERAGVRLHEVGTTNRTHLADYEAAIDSETALLLKVHRSNFEQRGFVAEADIRELAALANRHGIPLIEDLGSATLVNLGSDGLPEQAFAPDRLRRGVDVVCFSGDKLLGGPQAGILLGKRAAIDAMRSNPLARALRIDKLTVAALDASLDLMLEEGRSGEIPVIAGLRATAESLEPRARRLLELVSKQIAHPWRVRIEASGAAVGGGSLPEHRLPGWAVVLEGPRVGQVARRLRDAPTPVLARLRDDSLWLDVRTVREDEFQNLASALAFALL